MKGITNNITNIFKEGDTLRLLDNFNINEEPNNTHCDDWAMEDGLVPGNTYTVLQARAGDVKVTAAKQGLWIPEYRFEYAN